MTQARAAMARWMSFSVLLLLSVILQAMVFPRVSAVPNPMLSVAAVISLAVFSGPAGGAAAGFICGLLCDALLGTEAYFSLTMMGAGAVTGFLCGRVLQKTFWPAFLMSSVSIFVIESAYILFFQIAARGVPLRAFVGAGLPGMLAGILCVPLVYPAFRAVAKHFPND
ncbi:MAG: rod shape-determining protein MreD [Oscillospiraceae bacterium]|nr:rod shape-determining protein MreD [Oscillospiraceae bacterium]